MKNDDEESPLGQTVHRFPKVSRIGYDQLSLRTCSADVCMCEAFAPSLYLLRSSWRSNCDYRMRGFKAVLRIPRRCEVWKLRAVAKT